MKIKLTVFIFIFWSFLIFPSFVSSEYKEEPQRIIIPAVEINLPVEKARIVNETWEVLSDVASFGEGTSFPGEQGNTIIFSHAIYSLFGNLPNVPIESYVYLTTDSYTFTYKIVKTNSVTPDDLSILKSGNEKTLILYTCEGSFDEKRFVAKAVLVDISRSCRLDPLLTKNL